MHCLQVAFQACGPHAIIAQSVVAYYALGYLPLCHPFGGTQIQIEYICQDTSAFFALIVNDLV